ncbi:hypothetical protein BCR43DRAFT_522020 [Syncephalastrum racemosum]|uniref:Kaptin n=1 Tax=Syncephalastrum racemosum TaxID=13706 RepID=A0A1X2HP40_SYNRA|nr:hypothetical protein BCR43DRAFT_522020 [Syncephalastrum racemosum]
MSAFHPVSSTEDELFKETHYARYGVERTNIYGLATFESRLPTFLDRQEEFPSHRVVDVPTPEKPATRVLKKPVRHLVAASASEMTSHLSRDGYWTSLHLDLGLEAGQVEIIAVDAVETESAAPTVLLAIAVAERHDPEGHSMQYALHFFSTAKDQPLPYLEQALAGIRDSCHTIPMASAPMHLTHTTVQYQGHSRLAFLLSSMDGAVHMTLYDPDRQQFITETVSDHFPILSQLSESRTRVLFLSFFDRPNGQRVMCAGGQDGDVILAFYKDGRETRVEKTRVFSPITSTLLFQPRVSNTVREDDQLHLVVTCAIEQAIVYRSIETNGLSKGRSLPQSGYYDSVLCSHVMDVDWDGEREILIGTYGRQVLIYKQVAGTQDYNVLWRRQFAYPIYRMAHLDLNRDGLDELIVSTMYGIHIFQPNMRRARERLLDVLQHVEGSKRRIAELLLEYRHQKEMEKAIVFASQ